MSKTTAQLTMNLALGRRLPPAPALTEVGSSKAPIWRWVVGCDPAILTGSGSLRKTGAHSESI